MTWNWHWIGGLAPDWRIGTGLAKNWPIANPNYIAIGNCNYKTFTGTKNDCRLAGIDQDRHGLDQIGLDWHDRKLLLERKNDFGLVLYWHGLAWIGIDWKRTGLARIGVGLKMASDWNRVDVGLVRIGPGLASKWLRIDIGLAPNLLCVGRSEKMNPGVALDLHRIGSGLASNLVRIGITLVRDWLWIGSTLAS